MVRSSILRSLVSIGTIPAQKHGKKRTGKSRPEFKGENMKNMFTLDNDFVAEILGKHGIYKARFGENARIRQKQCRLNLAQYQVSPTSKWHLCCGIIIPLLGVIFMLTKNNVTIGVEWRFGPDWPGQRCGAKTRQGTACQRPAKPATLPEPRPEVRGPWYE